MLITLKKLGLGPLLKRIHQQKIEPFFIFSENRQKTINKLPQSILNRNLRLFLRFKRVSISVVINSKKCAKAMIKKQSDVSQKSKNIEEDQYQLLHIDPSKSVFKTPKKELSQQEQELGSTQKKDKFCMSELCTSFMNKYNSQPNPTVFSAKSLLQDFNVKQRRIYDLMNIMEGLGCVQKLAKGNYQWNGINKTNFDKVEAKKGQANSLRHVAARIKLIIYQAQRPISFSQIYNQLFNEQKKNRERQINPTSLRRRIYQCCKVLRILGCIRRVEKNYEWISENIKDKNVDIAIAETYKSPIRRPRRISLTQNQIIKQVVRKYRTQQQLEKMIQKIKQAFYQGIKTTAKKEVKENPQQNLQ